MILRLLTSIVFASLLSSGAAYSQRLILLDDAFTTYRLDDHVEILIDSSEKLTIKDVSHPELQKFFRLSNDDLKFGYLKSVIWLKITYMASSSDARWYLDIPAPFLEYVDFYQRSADSTWHHSASGYFRKQSERDFHHTGHVLRLRSPAGVPNTVYVRIAGVSPKTFTIHAVEREVFWEKTRLEDLGYGIFFGILILMFFYNVYIYITLRQKNYFLYSCIIACTLLIFAAISGYGSRFIWPEKPVYNYIHGKLLLEVLIVFLTVYVISFLNVKKYSKIMYYLLWSLVPLSGLALLLSSTQVVTSAGNNLITVATVVFMAAGIVVRIKGNKTGTYFIAAWTFFFLGGLFLTLRNSGVFDYGFWTTHFVEVGAVLGTTMIGFGLGAQYRSLKQEKEQAQLLALKFQQEATARLETKVNERTEQLYRANRDLQRTLATNRKQTEIIESKNAELDAFFYRISHDLKGPVSSSIGLMALAKVDVKDPLALEYIEREHAQLERLSHLITGLVNLAKLNNTQIAMEPIDFERMIDDCIMSASTSRKFPRIAFEKDIQPNVEFISEWTLVNAILQNLIENGIKYSSEDSPYLKVKIREEANSLVIQVEDNGPGISPEHQSKIFDMFYRATSDEEGSGLGLYILKRSVDRLNGKIEIISTIGKGSTFIVRLPHRSPVNGETSVTIEG